jgi:DNA-binding Lrp family transcriptional regulator
MATVGTSLEITQAEERIMDEKITAECKHSEILKNESRHEILNEFEDLGVNPNALSSLSIDELAVLLSSVKNMVISPPNKADKPKSKGESGPILSKSDKTILRRLVLSSGYTSSLVLSRELEIPMTTVQRRRKRLESDLVERNYLLKAERLGWRTATLYITSENGSSIAIGKKILEMNEMVSSVMRNMGENDMDIRVELFFRTNIELASILELIKSIKGVRNVVWSESIELIGKNDGCYQKIIDSL